MKTGGVGGQLFSHIHSQEKKSEIRQICGQLVSQEGVKWKNENLNNMLNTVGFRKGLNETKF